MAYVRTLFIHLKIFPVIAILVEPQWALCFGPKYPMLGIIKVFCGSNYPDYHSSLSAYCGSHAHLFPLVKCQAIASAILRYDYLH